jgi:nucleoside-diphosphate-sugar epimerase
MRALLLGDAGFTGLHLARRLLIDGYQVSIVDGFPRGGDDIEFAALREHRTVDIVCGDLTDPATYADLPQGWDTAGVSPRITTAPAPPGAVGRRCPDLSRLRALTGCEPAVPLEEGVRRTFDWYRESWPR